MQIFRNFATNFENDLILLLLLLLILLFIYEKKTFDTNKIKMTIENNWTNWMLALNI